MQPSVVRDLLNEWEKAQASWPLALQVDASLADLKDCQRWLRETRAILASPLASQANPSESVLTPVQTEFVATFQRRVLIYAGDLKANPFECSLSECG
jgi:hypothetical protein